MMCKDCGCAIAPHSHPHSHPPHASHSHPHEHHHEHAHPSLTEERTIEVLGKILGKNDTQAGHNRAHFAEAGLLCVNLMSSPGSGKTTLLEKTITGLKNEMKIAVLEGDLETNNDAKRIRAAGAPAWQITTGQSCHLDAFMIHDALHNLEHEAGPLAELDLLFIENVGNLVCPASYDLGQHLNVVLLSATEGSDKPAKYPVIFKNAQLVLITKIEVAPLFDFDLAEATRLVRELNPHADLIALDAKNGTNLNLWFDFLRLKKELSCACQYPHKS